MERIVFRKGDFIVWKDKTYRVDYYTDEYELFDVNDTEKEVPLRRIPKSEAEDHYSQFAECDIRNVRYPAVYVDGDLLFYQPHINEKNCLSVRIDETNEIWIQRNRGVGNIEIEDIWLSPQCKERPGSQKFYAEPMANGGIMEVHLNVMLSFDETAKVLSEAFGDRIKINKGELRFDDEYFTTFELDGRTFNFDVDCWDLVGISPKYIKDSPLIHEIVKVLNDSVKKER